jgi:hypothetical protein
VSGGSEEIEGLGGEESGGGEDGGREDGGGEDGGGEDVASARMGREGGSIDTEGGVSGNNRKEMSSTEKAEEEGRG